MSKPRSVIVKTMVTAKNIQTVFEFFTDIKNWKLGGALKKFKEKKMTGIYVTPHLEKQKSN